MVFGGWEHVVIALGAGPADMLLQHLIRPTERLNVVLPQVGEILPLVGLTLVAADAIPVEHRLLHLAVEAEATCRSKPGPDRLRWFS